MAPFKIQVVGTTANKIGEVAGSNPVPAIYALVAQLVERRTENPYVTGSIPVQGIFLLSKGIPYQ